MALQKLERCCRTPPGCRLATVAEVENNMEWIKQSNLLEEWDRARLLDGWIGGAGYDWHVQVGFKSCLGYMLVVETQSAEISNTVCAGYDRNTAKYSQISLSREGRSAALFLCSEDWNYDVLHWLMEGLEEEGCVKMNAVIEDDHEAEAASKLLGVVARELHSVCGKGRVRKAEFSRASMEALTAEIQDSVEALATGIPESGLRNIAADILTETSSATEYMEIGYQCWAEMSLTEDLKRFRELGFDTSIASTWEAVADTIWYVVADAMASVIVREFCRIHDRFVTRYRESADRKTRTRDRVCAYANERLLRVFYGTDSLWKFVEEAAKKTEGDCKRFNESLRDEGYGTFKYNGKYDVVNIFLVQAAKEGDSELVQMFLENGVQPSETDDIRGKTALHHAAKLEDESKGLEIATKLLTKERSLANAVDHKMRTPLHRAAFCGHASMCRLLLSHGANVTSKDKSGRTPLHHALMYEQPNEEVVQVLISAGGHEENAGIVDVEDKYEMTPLHLAIELYEDSNVSMVARMLSLSTNAQSYFKHLHLSSYLRESSRMGYNDLVRQLLKEGADPDEPDDDGKRAAHYAAEGQSEEDAIDIFGALLCDEEREIVKPERATARDKYGRNVLHLAAFLGHTRLCQGLIDEIPNIDVKDGDGQTAIYYAVAGSHDKEEVLDIFISKAQGANQDSLKDDSQTTPLHMAAEKGNLNMVKKLLKISGREKNKYVGAANVQGQTALHLAASRGHKKIVKELLDEGVHPLKQRDSDGKTALHYAAQAENDEDAKAIAKFLLNKCKSSKEKLLLLFASAVGIGSAEQSLSIDSRVKDYLAEVKEGLLNATRGENLNLLRVAATLGDVDMTRELLTRGASIAVIRNPTWKGNLKKQEQKNVEEVIEQIQKIVEQGTDKPTLWDNLGRNPFANGLAAFFLNPFVKSPITVGITGEWGMGKSSLMVQTESILLRTAAQLAFSNSFQQEDFPGASKSTLSAMGQARRKKIVHALEKLVENGMERENKPVLPLTDAKKQDGATVKVEHQERDSLDKFLENYEPKYYQIFKSLAVMDRSDMFEESMEKVEEGASRNQSSHAMPWEEDWLQGTTPSVLTVHYNAWHYRNESEAWAGLAVEITKELEATMTVAQKLRTSWRYNWTNRRNRICFGVILPCFLAILVSIWLTIIVWFLLDRVQSKDIKDFKYGSLPVSLIVAAWGVGKSVMSFVKPISSQVVDYICLPDHTEKLGYHQKVVSDINFLKDGLCYRPSWFWKMFGFLWCCITFSWKDNYVPHTEICKMPPASKDSLRIVVFVDDLDRCEENVILQILSAVHLVLASCEINVILGMDKSMIERAIIKKFGDKNNKPDESNRDLAEKYLRKIIQLPLDLPDPSDLESDKFLQVQLGVWDGEKGSTGSAAQKEIHNTRGRRRVNPKFQIGSSIPNQTKAVRGEATECLTESGAKQGGEGSFSGIGFAKMKRQESIEKPVGTGMEETKIEINESTYTEQGPDENEQVLDARRQREEKKSEIRRKDLKSLTTEMLIPKYSEGERNAFRFLHKRSSRSRKLPREWKCLMTYHRLAWNILSGSPEVIQLSGWQVQLIAWVFVCWHWKHLITALVQKWDDLGVLKKWVKVEDIQKGELVENSGPSLREIVEYYMDDRWPPEKKSGAIQGDIVKKKKEDAIDNASAKVGDKSCSNTEEMKEASGGFGEEDVRNVSSEEDVEADGNLNQVLKVALTEEREKKRGQFLKIQGLRGSKKGKRKQAVQVDLEGGLKSAIRKVLQEEEVKDMMRAIIKEAFKEETKLKEASTSHQEGNKRESSLQQGKAVKENQKASHKVREEGKNKAKDEEERKEWRKLKETLSRYNVSMEGIQAFQKFRFYCDPGHLSWPLRKEA